MSAVCSAAASSSFCCRVWGAAFVQFSVLRLLNLSFNGRALFAGLIRRLFSFSAGREVACPRKSSEDFECSKLRFSLLATSFASVCRLVGKDSSSIVWPRGRPTECDRLKFRNVIPVRERSLRFYVDRFKSVGTIEAALWINYRRQQQWLLSQWHLNQSVSGRSLGHHRFSLGYDHQEDASLSIRVEAGVSSSEVECSSSKSNSAWQSHSMLQTSMPNIKSFGYDDVLHSGGSGPNLPHSRRRGAALEVPP